jgi:succinyl-CoA synthetase beta subunit
VEDLGIDLPIVVRLTGTNEEEGKKLLEESDIEIDACTSMEEAAEKAVDYANQPVA